MRIHTNNFKTAFRDGALTGLATSTFSTLMVQLGARRIGRDPNLSWMEVGMVALRGKAVQSKPGARGIIAGILVHQFADLSWATLFSVLGGGRGRGITPATLLALAPPWAAVTEVIEYYVILPWLQPRLTMQTPYWVGLGAHLASASAYPLLPLIRERVFGEDVVGAAFGRRWLAVLGGALGLLTILEVLGRAGHELRWPLDKQKRAYDRSFMRRITAHHQLGVRLAGMVARQAAQDELRMLGRLMQAEQTAEIEVLRLWWRSWVEDADVPPPTPEEQATMPGMPSSDTIAELADLRGAAFEARWLPVMIAHHQGAIAMSDEAWTQAGDPRLRLFAAQVRHAQDGQVKRMAALGRAVAE